MHNTYIIVHMHTYRASVWLSKTPTCVWCCALGNNHCVPHLGLEGRGAVPRLKLAMPFAKTPPVVVLIHCVSILS